MASIALALDFPPYPEGAEYTVDEFLAWLASNATFEIEGDFLGGQIGGTRPTSNVGLYVTENEVEVWDADRSKYVTATSVPIGGCIPWAGASAAIPNNYLLCDGRVVSKTDYAELASVLGTTWAKSGDATGNFRLPDMRGRMVVGAGDGEYKDITGTLPTRTVGEYIGQHWPKNQAPWKGAPTGSSVNRFAGATAIAAQSAAKTGEINPPAAVMQWIIRCR